MPCGPARAPRGALRRDAVLLPLRAVAGLGGLLGRAPPGLVGDVPVDGLPQSPGEVGVRRPPAELPLELRAVDGKRIRTQNAYDRQYLAGRYGADPYLRSMLEWGGCDEQ